MTRLPARPWIVIGFGLLAVAGVLMRPLMPIDETRYLSVAWEMRIGDHWLVPYKNGAPYDHKPPLLFWLINLAWLPGVSETAARLVAPAVSLAMLWQTGRLSDRLGLGGRTGTLAMLILATLAAFVFYGGTTRFDTMLGLAVLLGLGALWRIGTDDAPTVAPWLAFGAALALGIMSKGPVVFVHLLPPLVAMPLWARAGGRLRQRGVAAALAVCAGLVLVWLGPALALGGEEYRRAVLWTQSAGRTVSSYAHAHPVWYYLPLLPVLVFPWAFLPGFWRRIGLDPVERLLWVSVLGPLVLFSLISGKQLHYLVPQLPLIALLLARRAPERLSRPWMVMAILAVLALGFVAMSLGGFGADLAVLLPLPAALLLGAVLLAATLAMYRVPALVALAAPAMMIAVDLAYVAGPMGRMFSPAPIGQVLAAADGRVGFAGVVYHADFQFAGRLRHPLTMLDSQDRIHRFAQATPEGVIVADIGGGLVPDWPPSRHFDYRNQNWAIWSAKEMP